MGSEMCIRDRIWFKIPQNLSESDATIYVYYGNPSATWSDDPESLFVQFDDFETDGGWTYEETDVDFQGSYSTTRYSSPTRSYLLYADAYWTTGGSYAQIVRTFTVSSGKYNIRVKSFKYHPGTAAYDVMGKRVYLNTTLLTDTDLTYNQGVWKEDSWIQDLDGTYQLKLQLYCYDCEGGDWYLYWDDFLIRRVVDPEPQHGSWGSEEGHFIGEFASSEYVVQAGSYFYINATVIDNFGSVDIANVTVELSDGVILKWDNATDTFSIYQDTNGYCTLDASGSSITAINSTAYRLSWKIKLSSTHPEGYIDIVANNTRVTDSYGIYGSNFEDDLFYVLPPQSGSWLSGWSYRKSITISNVTGAGTGYQIKLRLHYGSGTDNPATGDIYLNGKCRTDFGDVRFTTSGGLEINYWLRKYVAGDWAEFWVKIPEDLSVTNRTIYVYYGNSDATTTSNQLMTDIVQLREYKWYSSYNPDVSFIQDTDALKIESATSALGRGLVLIVVNRTWLNGKYIRLYWQGIHVTEEDFQARLEIWDGAYECSSSSDFPGGGAWATKGAGRLYSYASPWSPFTETVDVQPDLSSGTEDYCTIFIFVHDQSSSLFCRFLIYFLEINTGPNGEGNLWKHEFNTNVVMEQTGTTGDYGLVRKYVSPEPTILEIGSEETGGGNTAPCIGEFQAPSTVYSDSYFLLNATIQDADGVLDLQNATIHLGSVVLKWIATDTFAVQSDPNNYCALDADNSFLTVINSTAYKLTWRLKLSSDFPAGNVDVNGTVYDDEGASGTGSASALFNFVVISNNVPSVESIVSPSIVYADRYFLLNVTVQDAEEVADLDYATVQIGTIVLKWDSSTDSFSEQSDPSGLCTLDASDSTKIQIDSTSYKLSFRLKLSWSFMEGSVDVSATVYDVSAASGSFSQAELFTFEDDVVIQGCYII